MTKTPKTTTAPTGNIAPFGLRMLPELRAKVEESAKNNGRSMNAEIVARLQESLEGPRLGFGPGSVGERLVEAEARLVAAHDSLNARADALLDERANALFDEIYQKVKTQLMKETGETIEAARQAAAELKAAGKWPTKRIRKPKP